MSCSTRVAINEILPLRSLGVMLCIVAQAPTLVIDAPTSNAVLFMALMYGVELRELQTEVNTPSYLMPQGFF